MSGAAAALLPEDLRPDDPLSDDLRPQRAGTDVFHVRLANFEGPFDLLLSLIGRRRLDVTEIALAEVTDDFIAHIGASGGAWDLGQTTQFLVVAATLLDLKTARLLPSAEVESEEDLALLEARDLLFARLLQYRAYKLMAAHLAELLRVGARRHPRTAAPEPRFAGLLPDVMLGVDASRLAVLAADALRPRPVPVVATAHVHTQRVSVQEHMTILTDRLRGRHSATFRVLIADCGSTLEVVARFLGLLELYRDGSVSFDQAAALADLLVRWSGPAEPADEDVPAGRDKSPGPGGAGVDEEYG